MPRPPIPPEQRRKPRGLRLNSAELAELDRLAAALGCSRNSAVVIAVDHYLKTVTDRVKGEEGA